MGSGQPHSSATSSPGKEPFYAPNKMMGAPHIPSGCYWNKEKSPLGTKPWTIYPTAQSPYCLHYFTSKGEFAKPSMMPVFKF